MSLAPQSTMASQLDRDMPPPAVGRILGPGGYTSRTLVAYIAGELPFVTRGAKADYVDRDWPRARSRVIDLLEEGHSYEEVATKLHAEWFQM